MRKAKPTIEEALEAIKWFDIFVESKNPITRWQGHWQVICTILMQACEDGEDGLLALVREQEERRRGDGPVAVAARESIALYHALIEILSEDVNV